MLVFNCTKAALSFFSYTKNKQKITPEQAVPDFAITSVGTKKNPLSQWLLQCSKIAGRHVIFACHIHHRYVMIFTNLEKNNWQGFVDAFIERYITQIKNLLADFEIGMALAPDLEEKIRQSYQSLYCCARYDASTLRTITEADGYFYTNLERIGQFPSKQGEINFEASINTAFTHSKLLNDVILPEIELLLDFLIQFTGFDPLMAENLRNKWIENAHKEMFEPDPFFDDSSPELLEALFAELNNYQSMKKAKKIVLENLPSNVVSIGKNKK